MIVVLVIGLLKTVVSGLILILLPLQFLSVSFPNFVLDPVLETLLTIVDLFIWLFGSTAYTFFVATVLAITLASPAYHISVFVFHFISRVKGFIR